MKKKNNSLWLHDYWLKGWSVNIQLKVIDRAISPKISDRIMIILKALYPCWYSQQVDDDILTDCSVCQAPLRCYLREEDYYDEKD